MHIIANRKDGYHNLQTIFQLLDFCDELSFSLRNDGKIKRIAGNENILPERDLIIRAAKILQQQTTVSFGANIWINKKIPSGGGLGGGSSNAATTLIALNELWQLNLAKAQLLKIGLELGADVPVFVAGQSAWAQGVGEILTPIKLPAHYFLVVCINKSISTQQIFSHKALTKTLPIRKMANFSALVNPHNDCLLAALALENEIADALKYLNSIPNHLGEARMTGSGSCVFMEFENAKDAQVGLQNLPKKWSGFKAQGLNTSPIYHWAVAKR